MSAPARIARRAAARDEADTAEVVVLRGPATNGPAGRLEANERFLAHTRFGVQELTDRIEPRPVHGLNRIEAVGCEVIPDADDDSEPDAAWQLDLPAGTVP